MHALMRSRAALQSDVSCLAVHCMASGGRRHVLLEPSPTQHMSRRTKQHQRADMLAMQRLWRIYQYLANLEWTERVQHECRFCDRNNLISVLYEVGATCK